MSESTQVQRFEDMSPEGCLRLFRQGDGDIIVCAVPDPEECERRQLPPFGIGVEFCTCGGGGQSPNTRKALLALWEAIEKDNAENPQHRGRHNAGAVPRRNDVGTSPLLGGEVNRG